MKQILILCALLVIGCAPAPTGASLQSVAGMMRTIQFHQATLDSLIVVQSTMDPAEFAVKERLLRRRIARMAEALRIQAQPVKP